VLNGKASTHVDPGCKHGVLAYTIARAVLDFNNAAGCLSGGLVRHIAKRRIRKAQMRF
jgi:hypothetical protein